MHLITFTIYFIISSQQKSVWFDCDCYISECLWLVCRLFDRFLFSSTLEQHYPQQASPFIRVQCQIKRPWLYRRKSSPSLLVCYQLSSLFEFGQKYIFFPPSIFFFSRKKFPSANFECLDSPIQLALPVRESTRVFFPLLLFMRNLIHYRRK